MGCHLVPKAAHTLVKMNLVQRGLNDSIIFLYFEGTSWKIFLDELCLSN